MTKAELTEEIAQKAGVEKAIALAIVESLMDSIKTSLEKNENVYLRGFGSFILKKKAEKTGRIISQNKSIIIPAHNKPAFKPAEEFLNTLKNIK